VAVQIAEMARMVTETVAMEEMETGMAMEETGARAMVEARVMVAPEGTYKCPRH
jgi:hypothetical protein